jgi:hypothetical protein
MRIDRIQLVLLWAVLAAAQPIQQANIPNLHSSQDHNLDSYEKKSSQASQDCQTLYKKKSNMQRLSPPSALPNSVSQTLRRWELD